MADQQQIPDIKLPTSLNAKERLDRSYLCGKKHGRSQIESYNELKLAESYGYSIAEIAEYLRGYNDGEVTAINNSKFIEFQKILEEELLLLQHGKSYVDENMAEYGFCYDPEANDWHNEKLLNIIKKETPRAFLVNIEHFEGYHLNNTDIWVPKSTCVFNGRYLLMIDCWILEKIEKELIEKLVTF